MIRNLHLLLIPHTLWKQFVFVFGFHVQGLDLRTVSSSSYLDKENENYQ